jgi:hypothetical protein
MIFFFGKMVQHLGFSLCFPEAALVAKNAPEPKNTLAAHGLEELFFQMCSCVSFPAVVGNRFWF